MKHFAVLFLVTSLLHFTEAAVFKETFYEVQGNMECSATENFGDETVFGCAEKCNAKTDKLCVGVSYTRPICKLCLPCPKSNSPVLLPMASSFSITAKDFASALKEG